MLDPCKAVGHYAVSSLFQDYPERSELYSYIVDREFSRTITSGKSRMATGRCRITSKITWESSEVEYTVVHPGDHNIRGGAKERRGDNQEQEMSLEIIRAFENGDLPAVIRLMDEYFGQSAFSLGSLFKDEQRKILGIILETANADLEELNLRAYERTEPIIRSMMNLDMAPSSSFRNIATAVVNSQLLRAVQSEDLNPDHIKEILEAAALWQAELNKEGLEYALRRKIETLAQKSLDNPGDLPSLRSLAAAVQITPKLPFTVNYYRIQNIYFELLRKEYPKLKASASGGDRNARLWAEEFRKLGTILSFRVD
jgi:hypothetical protein